MAITIDGAGTITGLDADGISSQPVFAGNVLQVVSAVFTGVFTTTSNSYVNVYGATITPTNTSSKILVMTSTLRAADSWSGGQHFTSIRKGETLLLEQRANNYAGIQSDTANNPFNVALYFLDSPNTLSAVTYNLAIASGGGGFLSAVNRLASANTEDYGDSAITLMEIAG